MRGERASLQALRWPRRQVGPPPRPTTLEDLDPHKQPDTAEEAHEHALFLADQTPGLDETHCFPGHPNYRPGGTP